MEHNTQMLTLIAKLALLVLPDLGSLLPAHAIHLPGSTTSAKKSHHKSVSLLPPSGALTWDCALIPTGASIFTSFSGWVSVV